MLFDRFIRILKSNLNTPYSSPPTNEKEKPIEDVPTIKKNIPTIEDGYYANLELKAGASLEQIKKSYKTLMKKYHPDLFHNDEAQRKAAELITSKLNEAYSYFEKKFS